MTPKQRLLGQSALQAFRSDIVPGAPEPTSDDQSAILVATLLRQSLAVEDDDMALRIRNEAMGIARRSLGTELLSQGCTYDDHPSESTSDVIRLLSQRSDHAGRLHLARHLLESAAEIETDPIEAGRVLSDRAKTERKLGHLDLAQEQAQRLLREGRSLRSPELVARAHHGLGALAQTRGNFAEFRVRVRAVLRISRANKFGRLYAAANSGLGTSHTLAGRYGDAAASYWRAYELCGGKGFIAQTALGNLGQTLLISGRPAEARKVVTMLMQNSSLATSAPLFGTFAIASAQLGDSEAVRWTAIQLNQLAKAKGHAREIAEALMECSAALDAIGEKAEAALMKRRSEVMATQFGFHSLTFREALQSVQRLREPQRFNAAAARVTSALEELEVPRIPELAAALPA